MAIAKVEPLTTARALRGPVRLPPAAGDGRTSRSAASCGCRSGARRMLGVVVELAEASELPPERLAEPIEALEAGAPPELVELGLWVAREYCSTPSRGLQLVLPPGTGDRRGAAGPRERTELRAEITAAGRGGARAAASASALSQRAVLRGAARRARCPAPSWPTAVGADRADAAPARGARPGRDPRARGAPRARPAPACRGAAAPPELLPEQRSGRSRRSSPRSTARPGAAARAAPPRRHRLGQDRGLPGGGRGGAGAGPRRDRPRPRDRPDAAGRRAASGARLGDRVAVLHSALLAGRALRRVAAAAQRRGQRLRRPALGRLRAGRATSA